MPGACFVTASGTEIGKTFVTCRLVEGLIAAGRPAAAVKPVLSGWDPQDPASDARLLVAAQRDGPWRPAVADVSPWRFTAPLSPHVAARREGREIVPDELLSWCRRCLAAGHDPVLIEGVGGAFVPLAAGLTVADWIAGLELPALLVVDSRLGALSHGIAAFTALRSRGIRVLGVVVSQSPDEPMPFAETVESFAGFIDAPLFALPRIPSSAHPAAARALAAWYGALEAGTARAVTAPSLC